LSKYIGIVYGVAIAVSLNPLMNWIVGGTGLVGPDGQGMSAFKLAMTLVISVGIPMFCGAIVAIVLCKSKPVKTGTLTGIFGSSYVAFPNAILTLQLILRKDASPFSSSAIMQNMESILFGITVGICAGLIAGYITQLYPRVLEYRRYLLPD
jgi:hypothetical protein